MKKIICWLSSLTLLSALALFAFYFFKLNPQYCPNRACRCHEPDEIAE